MQRMKEQERCARDLRQTYEMQSRHICVSKRTLLLLIIRVKQGKVFPHTTLCANAICTRRLLSWEVSAFFSFNSCAKASFCASDQSLVSSRKAMFCQTRSKWKIIYGKSCLEMCCRLQRGLLRAIRRSEMNRRDWFLVRTPSLRL